MCPYEFGASDEQRTELAKLGALLAGCRDVFVAAFDDGMLTEQPGSQADHDFALRLSGPTGPWHDDVNIQPRALAAKLVREQVDFAVALGITVSAGELFRPMSSLVRSIVEYGTRATWSSTPPPTTRAIPHAATECEASERCLRSSSASTTCERPSATAKTSKTMYETD